MKTLFVCISLYLTILVALFPQLAVADGKANLDGFKEIKFDLSVKELTSLGYECTDGTCKLGDGVKKEYTLFSQEARVSVNIEENKVNSIDVTIDVTPDKMKELFSKSLGNPKVHKYVSLMGYTVEQYYWLFANGTSISVRKNMDKNTTSNLFGNIVPINFSSATYNGKKKTEKLLEAVKKSAVDKSDF
ncbi:hypothetical protein GO003_007190 [Methylicorpusculum oleiharenae]|uniref:hypothetical protein n=1 Tax=Methylicorpusculum oleiharenae TaxID=1338687 RepID=UPI0013593AE0|nr:hypothetical protein [Methylicorpusculum oleiharenae]MCD2450168.1 hypothetical protein [Methylicorpusculum oleiharenae]